MKITSHMKLMTLIASKANLNLMKTKPQTLRSTKTLQILTRLDPMKTL